MMQHSGRDARRRPPRPVETVQLVDDLQPVEAAQLVDDLQMPNGKRSGTATTTRGSSSVTRTGGRCTPTRSPTGSTGSSTGPGSSGFAYMTCGTPTPRCLKGAELHHMQHSAPGVGTAQ